MKSPFVSRETYEEAVRERAEYSERLFAALADVKAKEQEIVALKAAAIEAAATEQEEAAEDPIRSSLGTRQIVAMANQWARDKAVNAGKAD